ncbi:MAG TPA: hypothetical protein VE309_06250 [Caulobacteraceae bacterium]|jgi:hypothetical protein|nr:hypothetical protein [Caulobacteraceae bacterium]
MPSDTAPTAREHLAWLAIVRAKLRFRSLIWRAIAVWAQSSARNLPVR